MVGAEEVSPILGLFLKASANLRIHDWEGGCCLSGDGCMLSPSWDKRVWGPPTLPPTAVNTVHREQASKHVLEGWLRPLYSQACTQLESTDSSPMAWPGVAMPSF